MARHPNWYLAEEVLSQVIPGARGYDPELIPGLTPKSWDDFDIDGRDPAIVAEDLVRYCTPIVSGTLIIVTLQSFRSEAGPFFVNAKRLRVFVSAFMDAYDDVPVAGDTIVVSAATGVVVVVHHNGLIATLRGSKGRGQLDLDD
jgi:hypothetical protein